MSTKTTKTATTQAQAAAPQPNPKPKRSLSDRALAANRRNAQRSTGPRTAEGKSKIRLNAARHRITAQVQILPPEERQVIEAFCQPIADGYHPEGPEEIQLARAIAENYWRLNQVRAAIGNRFALAAGRGPHPASAGHPQLDYALHVAETFDRDANVLRLMTLYEQRTMNQLQKEKRELGALQEVRQQKRQAALEESRVLYKVATAAGQTWHPEQESRSNGGFVFSAPVLAAANTRAERLASVRQPESRPAAPSAASKYAILHHLAA